VLAEILDAIAASCFARDEWKAETGKNGTVLEDKRFGG
jgi:hypothetical protein